jgi:hypothetical protein
MILVRQRVVSQAPKGGPIVCVNALEFSESLDVLGNVVSIAVLRSELLHGLLHLGSECSWLRSGIR